MEEFESIVFNHITRFVVLAEEEDVAGSLVRGVLSHSPLLNTKLSPLQSLSDNKRPLYLVGQLMMSAGESSGEILIRDKTAAVCCVFQELNLSDIGQYILIWDFKYIQNSIHSYLEVTGYKTISSCKRDTDTVNKDSARRVSNLTGLVTAVSIPISNRERQPYLFVDLQTASEKHHIVVTNLYLQCCYRYLVINECYTFSNMKDSVLNKGQLNQLRVKTTTHTSRITRSSLRISTTIPYLTPGLTSYQGTVTRTVIPEAGLYELDSCVRLYMCCLPHFCNGEGLRQGAVLVISNAHLFKMAHPNWQFLSGFACCIHSSVRVLQLSAEDSIHYKPFHTSGNRLKKLLDHYPITHIALMLAVYSRCRDQLQISDVDHLLAILQHLIVLFDPTPSFDRDDPVSTFFSSPHLCSISSHYSSTSSSFKWPDSFPTLAHFKEVHYQQEVDTSNDDSVAWRSGTPVHWSLTESTSDTLLIGHIVSDSEGLICITDTSDGVKVPVVSPEFLSHIGSCVIITKMKTVVEHTTVCAIDGQNTTCHKLMYILPIVWKTVSNQTNTIPLDKKSCTYFIVTAKNRPIKHVLTNQLSFQVQVRISSNIDELSSSTGTECTLKIDDVDRYYSYIQLGCLYSLVSCDVSSSLAVVHITGKCCIELLEESERWDVLPPRDISELVDATLTQTDENKISNCLVTFEGLITKRSYRLSSSSSFIRQPNSLDKFTLALDMRSSLTPDTIILYMHLDQYTPPPGLVPGAKVKFTQVTLRQSHSSNIYCTYCPLSSVKILHSPLLGISSQSDPPACDLPVTYLNTLINQARKDALSRRIVCVCGRITSLQYVKVELECPVHGSGIGDSCHTACASRHLVKTEARGMFCDGSGECLIYFDSTTAKEIFKPEPTVWDQLTKEVVKHGSIKYYRLLEPQNPGENLLCTIVKSSNVNSEIKALCQPFNSKQDQGIMMKNVKLQMATYTVEVPQKLQLRVVSIQMMNYIQNAKKLFDTLNQDDTCTSALLSTWDYYGVR